MTDKLHLILDSLEVNLESPHDFTVQLEHYSYTKVRLISIYLHHESDVRRLFRSGSVKPIYIHCSMLNLNDSLLNGKKSDVLAVVYLDGMRQKRMMYQKFDINSFKLIKCDSKISMRLTTSDDVSVAGRGRFGVIYELEFS